MYCQAEIEGRIKCKQQCNHCKTYFGFLIERIEEGDIVTELKYNCTGVVKMVFENWEDLKDQSDFSSIDPNGKAKNANTIDLLINGDPRDEWLQMQEIPYTADQLLENWFLIELFSGGAIWTCRSCLKLSEQTN